MPIKDDERFLLAKLINYDQVVGSTSGEMFLIKPLDIKATYIALSGCQHVTRLVNLSTNFGALSTSAICGPAVAKTCPIRMRVNPSLR